MVQIITRVVEEYRYLIKGKYHILWERSFANKLGQLAHGIRDVKGTDTVKLIRKEAVPTNKNVTYGKRVCSLKPRKEVRRGCD